MSRSGAAPVAKVPSSENLCLKQREDRPRGSNPNKYVTKQRQESNSKNFNAQKHNNGGYYPKQPKQRGGNRGLGGRRNQVKAERQDAFSPLPVEQHGSKKTNLNHLLNFTYESELDDRHSSHLPRHRGQFHLHKHPGKTFFNKEQFIQANCQLVLKSGNDYSSHQAHVDLVVDWDLIEKVNMWSPEMPLCPICLDDPQAAKITKCGHIYCWPCILHYLALDDKSWRKCPICHEAVHKADLKSVSVFKLEKYSQQQTITMRLMKRKKDSTFAYPANQSNDQIRVDDISYTCDELCNTAQRNKRHLVADEAVLLKNIVEFELHQLEFKLGTEFDELEKVFIASAIKLCKEKQQDLEKSLSKKAKPSDVLVAEDSTDEIEKIEANSKPSDDQFFYFYQASDGQHIYLHPINTRCLTHQYQGFNKCPTEITGKILEMMDVTVTEETRKRNRYLSHLPMSLEYHVVELDLRPPTLEMSTLDFFKDQLEKRSAQRKKKVREEKKVLRKMHNEEMRKQGKHPAARISLESQKQFPNFPSQSNPNSGSFSVLLPTSSHEFSSSYPTEEGRSSSSSAGSSLGNSQESHGPSFAQMLKSSNSMEPTSSWPKFSSAVTSQSSSVTSVVTSSADADDDPDYVAPPTYQSSFGDALTSAIERMEVQGSSSSAGGARGKKGKCGKRNRKQVLLFSTSGQHHQ